MTALPGAYGLRYRGDVGDLLVAAPGHWPIVSVNQTVGELVRSTEEFAEDYAELALVDGWASLTREPARAEFTFAREMTEGELAHPYLTRVAAAHTYWLRRESFHAGAFLVDGQAWAIAADREGGKSSTLAGLAVAGYPIVVDDLVVTEGSMTFAGPRSIDLREGAARFLDAGKPMGIHGGRARFRLSVGTVPSELRIHGWIFLNWGEEIEVRPLTPFERLQHLMQHRMVRGPAQLEPSNVLRLASLPCFVLTRPRSFDAFGESLAALTEAVSQASGGASKSFSSNEAR